jgi:hypothetical protein
MVEVIGDVIKASACCDYYVLAALLYQLGNLRGDNFKLAQSGIGA